MLSCDVDRYVALQRTGGFLFGDQARVLASYAAFADARGQRHVHPQTVLDWSQKAASAQRRRTLLLTVRRFALVMRAEDSRHEASSADLLPRRNGRGRRPTSSAGPRSRLWSPTPRAARHAAVRFWVNIQRSSVCWPPGACGSLRGLGAQHRRRDPGRSADPGGQAHPALFHNHRGRAMTRAGFEYILAKHVAAATRTEPTLPRSA